MENNFGNNLRVLRMKKGLKQIELGKILGEKTKSAISNYEAGKRQPTLEDIATLCKYFGVSSDTLLYDNLSKYAQMDSRIYADYIRAELLRMELRDDEFNKLEHYIQFLKAERDGSI